MEALTIIFTMKTFHKFIHDTEFIVQTDHCRLLSIYGSKKDVLTHTENPADLGNYPIKPQ